MSAGTLAAWGLGTTAARGSGCNSSSSAASGPAVHLNSRLLPPRLLLLLLEPAPSCLGLSGAAAVALLLPSPPRGDRGTHSLPAPPPPLLLLLPLRGLLCTLLMLAAGLCAERSGLLAARRGDDSSPGRSRCGLADCSWALQARETAQRQHATRKSWVCSCCMRHMSATAAAALSHHGHHRQPDGTLPPCVSRSTAPHDTHLLDVPLNSSSGCRKKVQDSRWSKCTVCGAA